MLCKYLQSNVFIYFQGKDYFQRITKILAIYTDLELCSSVLGVELDPETANRIQFTYSTYLQVSFFQQFFFYFSIKS